MACSSVAKKQASTYIALVRTTSDKLVTLTTGSYKGSCVDQTTPNQSGVFRDYAQRHMTPLHCIQHDEPIKKDEADIHKFKSEVRQACMYQNSNVITAAATRTNVTREIRLELKATDRAARTSKAPP